MDMKARATEPFEESRDFVQSLARGLAVLRTFDSEHPRMTLAEVAKRSGLTRAASRRLLLTLTHMGYVRQNGREFSLKVRVLELGYGYLGSLNLTEFAQPMLEELAHDIGESCSLSALDGHNIVYVVRVPLRRVMSTALGVGARLPAAPASMGRVLLSGLSADALTQWLQSWTPQGYTAQTIVDREQLRSVVDATRRQGYAYVEQELEPGLCSIAVPIRNREGRIALALNAGLAYRPNVRRHAIEHLLPKLQATAAAIEAGSMSLNLQAAGT